MILISEFFKSDNGQTSGAAKQYGLTEAVRKQHAKRRICQKIDLKRVLFGIKKGYSHFAWAIASMTFSRVYICYASQDLSVFEGWSMASSTPSHLVIVTT